MIFSIVFRSKKFLIFTILLALFIFILLKLLQDPVKVKSKQREWQRDSSVPLIVWWSPILTGYSRTHMCDSKYFCKFTTNRDEMNEAAAFAFYGSFIKIDDFPLPRQSYHIWALLHEESPLNVKFMPFKEWLQHFNFTSTFSRHSNLPTTTFFLPNIDNLTTPAYTIPIGEKSRHKDQALVLFMQSNCYTMSGREDYVKELMKYISVDSYGKCLRNKKLPESLQKIQLDYLNNLYAPELLNFMARYKFVIAYENGICEDYITEKFWRPLIAGSIPVYFGSPTIEDWSPNEKSFIDISNFSSPEALATYLKELDTDDRAYNSYLSHKYNMLQPITNKRLLNELGQRKVSMNDDNLFFSFECALCSYLHEHSHGKQHFADERHYQCPADLIYPPINKTISNYNFWLSQKQVGKCEAMILDSLFKRNFNYTKDHFQELLTPQVLIRKC